MIDFRHGGRNMKFVKLKTERYSYSETECMADTITVGELIYILQSMDSESPVILDNDNGYTFGRLLRKNVREGNI